MTPGRARVESGYIPTLDGWRAVAIIAVIISHAQGTLIALGWGDERTLTVAGWGRLGVDLFFAISGFLICSRLLHEYQSGTGIRLREFYIRRSFRIIPLCYSYIFVISALGLFAGVPVFRREVIASVFFLRNYIDITQGGYTNHFWSLAVEEHFYLFWPLFLALMTPGRAIWVTPFLGIGVHLWRSLDARRHLFPTSISAAGLLHRTDTRIDAILWGCFAALLCSRLPRLRMPWWSAWATLVALIGSIYFSAPALPLVIALLFPTLIVSTALCPRGPLGRFLELGPLRWVGRLSYSLYIWQTLFLQASVGPDPAWLARLKEFPVNLVMILICSVASHYLLERPMIRVGRTVAGRPTTSGTRGQGSPPAGGA